MDGSELGMIKKLEMDRTIFLLQWWCNFKRNYSICCYLVVSPGKVTRSHEFPYKILVMGRSGFYANYLSVFSLQQKGSIFGPSWDHPCSWNGADGPELFNRCWALPRLGCIISKVTSGTHRAEWDVQDNTGFQNFSHQNSDNPHIYYFFSY